VTDSEIRRCLLDLDDTLVITERDQEELDMILRSWKQSGRLSLLARDSAVRIAQKHPDHKSIENTYSPLRPRGKRWG
jgi:predicted HAD superfamily phosphohydrolase YqeG